MLNKKFNNRKPDIWFKDNYIIIEVDEGNHENYDSDDEKEREDMFKNHSFKIFWCNSNNPEFILFKFLGEIILHISKLRKENAVNRVINKITEENSRSNKIKRIKTICQKHFTQLQKMKNTQSKIKKRKTINKRNKSRK